MPPPIEVNVNVGFKSKLRYQFHQVAVYTASIDESVELYEKLGFERWIVDHATLHGKIFHQDRWMETKVEATMAFNYDTMPMEMEFLHYHSGLNRHGLLGKHGDPPFISHMSTYVDDVIQAIKDLVPTLGFPYHMFVTQGHTNVAVAGKKRFIEAIFNTSDRIGYDLKLIQKVPHDFEDYTYLYHDFGTDFMDEHKPVSV